MDERFVGTFLLDMRAFAWLWSKHARKSLSRAAHFAGTDLSERSGAMERAYQLYIAAFFLAAFLALWSGVLSALEDVFAAGGPDFASFALASAGMLTLLCVGFRTKDPLRGRPLPLRRADVPMVLLRPVSLPAFVLVTLAFCSARSITLGAMVAQALAFGCLSSGLPVSVVESVVFGAFVGFLAFSLPLLAGLVRCGLGSDLAFGCRRLARSGKAWGAVLSTMVGVVALVGLVGSCLASPSTFVEPPLAVFAWASVVVVLGCTLASCDVDRTFVAERQGTGAGLSAVDSAIMASVVGSSTVKRWRRRSKMAERYGRKPPVLSLPGWNGAAALLGRSMVSLVRQREGWLPLLSWSAMAVPSWGLCLSVQDMAPVVVLLALASSIVLSPEGPREIGRAYADDEGNPLVRDRLPFGRIALLTFDSLPPAILCSLISSVSLVVLLEAAFHVASLGDGVTAASILSCIAYSAAFNSAGMWAGGLDFVRTSRAKSAIGCEVGLMAVLLLSWLGSHADPALGLAGASLGAALASCAILLALKKLKGLRT